MVFLTDPLCLDVIMRFEASTLVGSGLPDLNLDSLSVELNVGFNGSVTPVCKASAHLTLNDLDVSGFVGDAVVGAITKQIQQNPALAVLSDPLQVRAEIDTLFAALLRLDTGANIQSYSSDGQTLTVTYFVPTP